MYKLKPVFSVPLEIQNTCPMYKLKNLHEKAVNVFNKSDKDIYDEIQLSDQEIEILLKKQNDVLNTLKQLELRLNKLDIQFPDTKDRVPVLENQSVSLTSFEGNKKYVKMSKSETTSGIENLIKTDTVVLANPEDPPYSLLALPILWPGVSWDVSYHVHSSIEINLEELETMKLFKNVSCKDYKKSVKVIVIWQHTKPSPKVVRSPTDVLFGEVSLLKIFDQYISIEKLIAADQTKADKVLDLINEISCSTNDRTSELYSLINDSNTKLDVKNVVIWSLLYKNRNKPQNIGKWLEKFTKIIIS